MADAKSVASRIAVHVRQIAFRWRTGIGCRVSFFMMTALILVTSLIGALFFREGMNDRDEEIRGPGNVYCICVCCPHIPIYHCGKP